MKRRSDLVRGVLLAAVAALFGIQRPPMVKPPLRALGDVVGNASEHIAENVADIRRGRHLGFDTNDYPGDEAMRAWRDDGRYEWVGYYLPAPCHKDASWSGKRAELTQMGWGLAVLYVGQQTWDGTPTTKTVWRTKYVTRTVPTHVTVTSRRNGKRVTRTVTRHVRKRVPIQVPVRVPIRSSGAATCSRRFVSGERGAAEAADAIARASAEGFPRGTTVFLDIEYMDHVAPVMRDYYRAWVARVLADGRFRPGVYVHTHNAELVYADVKALYAAAGVHDAPPFWVAGKPGIFSHDKAPVDVGHAFAAVWQGLLDVVETRNGIKLPIDVSVAALPSPSAETAPGD